ncbi:hypothetical protein ALC57_05805 [Trachymyrmex cornetzi]|uniref:Uncharacterized protein n=1 Tax=Trachymyrmex cornetzi TaxID=471704 RepID=A0A151JA27_9HYME|nr:hypothetical protein ALC57_05805 [Trachymyrmex cornetzi]
MPRELVDSRAPYVERREFLRRMERKRARLVEFASTRWSMVDESREGITISLLAHQDLSCSVQ